MKKYMIILFLLLFIIFEAVSIELADKKGRTLDLKTDIIFEPYFNLTDTYWTFPVPSIDLQFEGNDNDKKGFEVSFALEEIFNNDLEEVLDTAFIWFSFNQNFTITLGQFKAPFGEEIFLSKRKRAYPFHSFGSKEIAPGLDRGISFRTDNLANGILGFDVGVFNGSGTAIKNIEFNSFLTCGNLSLTFNIRDKALIKTGYSALFQVTNNGLYDFTFSQGVFGKFTFKIVGSQEINIFSEYLEKHTGSEALNAHPKWSFTLFNMISHRIKLVEYFIAFDLYRDKADVMTLDDEWKLGGGFNLYPVDNLKFSIFYEAEDFYNIDGYEHQISMLAYLRF